MFRYTVEYHDEITGELSTSSGIVAASTYGAAADRLVEYHGLEYIVSVSIYMMDDVLCDEELRDMLDE